MHRPATAGHVRVRPPSAHIGGVHPTQAPCVSPLLLLGSRRKQLEYAMARSLVALFLRAVLAFGLLAAGGAALGLVGAPAGFDALSWWTSRLWGLAPAAIVPFLSWTVMVVELILALLLLLGLRTRTAALVTGVLFLAVAAAMTLRMGIEAPFHAAIFAIAGVAFAIQTIGAGRVSFDGA